MIIEGDCLEVIKTFESNSISATVTDPPYGLKFMGKEWDHGVPGFIFWKHLLRICKPGSFLLAFGGTRTFHRLACNIEDAGWEIRDCLMWLYGSGFPKSHNHFGLEGYGTALKPAWEPIIMAMKPCDGTFAQNAEKWAQAGINIDDCRIGTTREVPASLSKNKNGIGIVRNQRGLESEFDTNKGRWPANLILDEEAAEMLDEQSGILKKGYGTALKPSWEPIIMAMKPCDGTFAQNAEKWAQAGINIDDCRIGITGATNRSHQCEYPKNENGTEDRSLHWARTGHNVNKLNKGRWPANLILDEKAAEMLDEQSGILKSNEGASRFFYCAKASSAERNRGCEDLPLKQLAESNKWTDCDYRKGNGEITTKGKNNNHPTIKPLKLMEYLIKLIMPPKDGVLLDPFAGSGTTILAAKNLGYEAIGIELNPEYCEIARKRISA